MLNMRVILPIVLLFGTAVAMEQIVSPNHVDAGELSEDSAEGRACGTCGGTTHKPTAVHVDTLKNPDLILHVLNALPVLAFHILGLILLGLLIKHLLSKADSGPAAYPAASDAYYYSGQSYADPAGYTKRSSSSSWSLQDIQSSPVVTFLTQVVSDAIEKYNVIEKN